MNEVRRYEGSIAYLLIFIDIYSFLVRYPYVSNERMKLIIYIYLRIIN